MANVTGTCGKCGGDTIQLESRLCGPCIRRRWPFMGWRPGQVVGLSDQVAFIVGRSENPEYPEGIDVRWVDTLGGTVTMPYSHAALLSNGNRPGEDRTGVPAVERVCRNPLQVVRCVAVAGVSWNGRPDLCRSLASAPIHRVTRHPFYHEFTGR
jgi:hypothetical protein